MNNIKKHIEPLAIAIFVVIGCVGVITSTAQYVVGAYDNEYTRLWLIIAVFVGYMALFVYIIKIVERHMKTTIDK